MGKNQTSSTDCEKLIVTNKFTLTKIKEISLANESDIENILEQSYQAHQLYKKTSAQERSHLLHTIWEELKLHEEEFIRLISIEAGKPKSYAQAEWERSLYTLKASSNAALEIKGEVVPIDIGAGQGRQAYTQRFPIGPIFCITPFNFPLNLAMHKIAPALACGNTVILKSALQTPLTCTRLNEIINQVTKNLKNENIPDSIFQHLVCSNEHAERIVKDKRVSKISFTGSDKVGWKLKGLCGKKRITLELGGNAAVIIDEVIPKNLNLASIAQAVAKSAFLYAGQICISTQRVLVHKKHYKNFTSELIKASKELYLYNNSSNLEELSHCQELIIGPIISLDDAKRIMSWCEEATTMGAKEILNLKSQHKHIIAPKIFTETTSEMKIASDEVFGPICTLETFEDINQAFESVNRSRYGLQTGLYSDSLEHMKRAFRDLEVGAVIMNGPPAFRVDTMPYGGIKDSGFGREGVKYAIEEMTETKLLVY